MEGDVWEGRPPGMAGDRQGARPPWARRPETNTEGSCNPMTSAVFTCVHEGRRVKKTKKTEETANHRTGVGHTEGDERRGGPRGAQRKKDTRQNNVNAPPEDTQH